MTTLYQARPTTYNGIQMRSRLEAAAAANLDREGVRWTYEPRCFASGSTQYLPDFEVSYPAEWAGYLEVKPTPSYGTGALCWTCWPGWKSSGPVSLGPAFIYGSGTGPTACSPGAPNS